jgi:tRNA threonylcarbamoyladenosine biosynthesis protein TsaE
VTAATPEHTATAGEALGRTLKAGDVVALYGELGAGKTCFVQGLVRVSASPPAPPAPPSCSSTNTADAGRSTLVLGTASLAELMDLGLLDLFGGEGVTLLEWADRAEPLLPARAIRVRIDGLGDEPREVTIEDPRGLE